MRLWLTLPVEVPPKDNTVCEGQADISTETGEMDARPQAHGQTKPMQDTQDSSTGAASDDASYPARQFPQGDSAAHPLG